MSGALGFDRQRLEVALLELDSYHRSLPDSALSALAEEVVSRVAKNLTRPVAPEFVPGSEEIDTLCDALLSEDHSAAPAFIEAVRRAGTSYEVLCQAYLGAAAQRMGERWDNDKVSFYRVTIGAGRIYAILRVLRTERPVATPDMRRAAVFASVPGENHTLGITMASDMARERGWDIELFVGLTHEDLVQTLEKRKPALIGLSASGIRSLTALTKLIVALRISHPGVQIMICGQIVNCKLSLVGVTGADAVAHDFESAIGQLERLRVGRGRLI